VSPWNVRGLGIFLASGGSIVMNAQSNDGSRQRPPGRFEALAVVALFAMFRRRGWMGRKS
jgi:hypothetical protein